MHADWFEIDYLIEMRIGFFSVISNNKRSKQDQIQIDVGPLAHHSPLCPTWVVYNNASISSTSFGAIYLNETLLICSKKRNTPKLMVLDQIIRIKIFFVNL